MGQLARSLCAISSFTTFFFNSCPIFRSYFLNISIWLSHLDQAGVSIEISMKICAIAKCSRLDI